MPNKIVIIGAGPGGYVAALRAAQSAADVTLLEKDMLGGTCLNWGCIPSKIMKKAAEMLISCGRMEEFGINLSGTYASDLNIIKNRMNDIIGAQKRGIEAKLKQRSVRTIKGMASLAGPESLVVRPHSGDDISVSWDRLIIATGSRPLELQGIPFDGDCVISSDEVFSISNVPQRLVIVGGGVVGCEFASIFSALGSSVTIVEALTRLLPLPSIDRDSSKVLQREFKKRRISFLTETVVESVERTDEGARVMVRPADRKGIAEPGKEKVLLADKVLVCVGRSSTTEELGLERIGISCDKSGWIEANERMETKMPGIYAIGDVLGPQKVMLAHVASEEGIVAAENALGGARVMTYGAIPSAIFTEPEIASVGLSEEGAMSRGYEVTAESVLFRSIGKAQVLGDIAGHGKIVAESVTGKILGVHLAGPHATDLITEGTLAVKTGMTVKELSEIIHPHPTLSEIMFEVSQKSAGTPIHG